MRSCAPVSGSLTTTTSDLLGRTSDVLPTLVVNDVAGIGASLPDISAQVWARATMGQVGSE